MALRVRAGVGPLVKVPFTAPVFTSNGTGSSASLGTTQPNNADGKNQQAVLTCGAGATCYAGVKDIVYGPVVGIRIPRSSGSTRAPFDVEIDGVAYPVDVDANTRFDNVSNASVVDYESLIVVATDLEDKAHTVKVHVSADISGSPSARVLSMFGWVGAQGRGYHQPPLQRQGGMSASTPTTITASLATISAAGLVKGFTVYNGDASARVVTITGPDGVTPWRKLFLAASGSSGDTQYVEYPTPRTISGVKWGADAATGSNIKGWIEVI